MTEQLSQHQFAIANVTEADLAGVAAAHFQSMLETYPNEAVGIDQAWIQENLQEYGDPNSKHRREDLRKAETDPDHNLYLAVKNAEGKVVGFFHATRTDEQARVEAIYLTEEARGSGVADDLMQRGIEFADGLPMRLEVMDYNERAIRFYEKYGFERVPGTEEIQKEKLPVYAMERPGTGLKA